MGGPFKSYRLGFLKEFVAHGHPPKDITYASVPQQAQEKWINKFLAPIDVRLSRQPRLVNRFMLGADPEFIFVRDTGRPEHYDYDREDTIRRFVRVDAAAVGLKTGLAFGADQNGRLIEMRPRPDRFALKVLASCWAALKWMALMHPETLKYEWQCGAFLFGDGLGGHIHFGRKRPTRDAEVRALDKVGGLTYQLGIFPKDQWDRRQEGDERGQRYGRFGDFRPQIHGYEYRTLPSWLDDPWVAYLCMVLSKLAVYNPELTREWNVKDGNHIRHILAFYKGLDDDAAIALKALDRIGLPQHKGGDFKGRWGFTPDFIPTPDKPPNEVEVIPGSIEPTESEVEQLFKFLVDGETLVAKPEKPTWSPTKVPSGFYPALSHTEVIRVAGMGELLTGLYCNEKAPIKFYANGENSGLRLSRGLVERMPSSWKETIQKIAPKLFVTVNGDTELAVGIPEPWRRVQRIQVTKKILTCGVFPVWKLRNATQENFQGWQERKAPEKSYRTVVLREA